MVYLFIGQDSLSKDTQIKKIKQEFLKPGLEQFNFDLLYARDLTLKALQERVLCLPFKSPKRVILVREAQALKEELKGFIQDFSCRPNKDIVLILDMDRQDARDKFPSRLHRDTKIFHIKETVPADAFTLSRQIALKKPAYALRILSQLLSKGERPERILGGLRYAWEKDNSPALARKRKLKLLLNCDIEIKTGKLKPVFALEKLVVSLCGPG
ncbi:MAG: hypothetical protein PHG40_04925 [Candidatus Omnitrophica bacterium]|nr:hypothetical protein [Candidatus Omnitrophota bacterium]